MTSRSRTSDILGLVGWLVLCFLAAAIGGLLTSLGIGPWYDSLPKPSWTPPSWLFGPVWTALYTAMAVAAWLVWRKPNHPSTTRALGVFGFQLALNVAWSGAFFALGALWLSVVIILALLLAIAATARAFWPHSRVAALLLVPYLAWVGFASALNIAIARLGG